MARSPLPTKFRFKNINGTHQLIFDAGTKNTELTGSGVVSAPGATVTAGINGSATLEIEVNGQMIEVFGALSYAAVPSFPSLPPLGSLTLSVAGMRSDMVGPHEANIVGLPPEWSWGSQADPGYGLTGYPVEWTAPAYTMWGIVGPAASGSPATNVRVQIRHLRADFKRAGIWYRAQSELTGFGGANYTDYTTNASTPADVVQLGNEGLAVQVIQSDGHFHFFTAGRAEFYRDLEALVVSMDTRLVLDNPNGIDDIDSALIYGLAAGDIYQSMSAEWPNNGHAPIGRLRRIGRNWRLITAHLGLSTDAHFNEYITWVNSIPAPISVSAALVCRSSVVPQMTGGTPVAGLGARSIGGNFQKRANYQTPVYADLVNGAYAFAPLADGTWGTSVALDANGWPTVANKILLWTNDSGGITSVPSGVYKVSYTDTGSTTLTAVGGGVISNVVRVGNNVTLDITNPPIGFFGIEADGGYTNLKVVLPGYDPVNPPVLRTEAVDHFKQFSILRLMDMMGINTGDGVSASTETTWALRKTGCNVGAIPTWELVFAMGNQLRSAPSSNFRGFWVCFQKNVTTDYYTGFANLWLASMPSDCVLYAEDLNELWNSGTYAVSQQIFAEAEADTTSNIATWVNPRWGGTASQFDRWFRLIGKRCAIMAQALVAAFPGGSLGNRLRPVLGTFIMDSGRTVESLDYMAQFYGPVSGYLTGLAGAPYTSGDPMATDTAAAIVQGLRTTYDASVTTYPARCAEFTTIRNNFGLQEVVAYEWGPHTHIQENIIAKRDAHLLPAMGTHNQELGQVMWDAGWTHLCYYNVGVGPYSATDVNSFWSVSQDFNANEPKLNGLKALIAIA